VTMDGFGLIFEINEHFQTVTTSNYNAIANSLQHVSSPMSSASMLMFALAGHCHIARCHHTTLH
jgi:hypothetical protein